MIAPVITLYFIFANLDRASGFNPSRKLLGVPSTFQKKYHNYINSISYSNSVTSKSTLYAENSLKDSNLPLKGQQLQNTNGTFNKLKIVIPVVSAALGAFALSQSGIVKLPDITSQLEGLVSKIESLGPYGYLYFSLVYIAAEVLAIPVMPLTASSGYLFGMLPGSLVVLLSATIAACISFGIGRTFLRDWARSMTAGSSLWRMVDTAVKREGFKIILLLRLSPLLPFAVSNYLYGITSVDFPSYFLATLLGFAPGSIGIVYAGSAGKALLEQHGGSIPWYLYAGIGLVLAAAGRVIAKVATDTVQAIQEEDELEQRGKNSTNIQ